MAVVVCPAGEVGLAGGYLDLVEVKRRRLRTLAQIAALLGVWAVWFVALSPTGLGGPVGMVWVSGTSMEPGLHSGDLVVTYERDSYAVGDVVAFEIPEGGNVIHRIIEITDDGLYRFQGDNRGRDDPWSLPADAIVGRSVIDLPNAALIVHWLSRPISLALMVAVLCLLMFMQDQTSDDEMVFSQDLEGQR